MDSLWVSILLAFAAVVVIFVVPAYLICRVSDWLKERRERRDPQAARLRRAEQRLRKGSKPSWLALVSIGVIVAIIVLNSQGGGKPVNGRAARQTAPNAPWIVVPAGIGLAGACMAVVYLRQVRPVRNRGVERVLKQSVGNWADAEREVLRQIETQGPSPNRSLWLGLALVNQQKEEAAVTHFVAASEAKGHVGQVARDALGIVVMKLGRLEEAEAHLQRAYRESPNNLNRTCNYCLILAKLGRADAARDLLAEAELLHKSNKVITSKQREALDRRLEECRQEVAALKPKPLEIDEV